MKRAFRLAVLVCIGIGLTPTAWSQVPDERAEHKTYLMQVVLLLGGTEGQSSFDQVPKNAQKALTDIQDFLPFKSYRLLDIALIRSAGIADGRLSGPNGEDYHVEMHFTPIGEGDSRKLLVRGFELNDQSTATASLDRARDAYAKAAGAPAPPMGRSLISSSFTIEPGETIVVGSSTLRSSTEALIVLLTAIP
jgi:hypothetical protein